MSARKSRSEETRDKEEGRLKRRKLSANRVKTAENCLSNGTKGETKQRSSKQQRNGGNKREDNKKSRSSSFLPKINPNGNRGTVEMRGVNDLAWPHEPRVLKKGEKPKKKHVESYLDTYYDSKNGEPKKDGVNLPDIEDKKGTVARHQRTIGKSKTKEIVKLDVFDNGVDPVKGKFEKPIALELPAISGQNGKTSPRRSPISPTPPAAGSPTRSRSRKLKFPPLN